MSYYTQSHMIAEMADALSAVYRKHGPRDERGRVVPAEKYAAMSRRQINEKWDFSDRHLMHRVAKALQ